MAVKKKKAPPAPRPPVKRSIAVRAEGAPEPEAKNFNIRDNTQLRWLAGLHYSTSLAGTSIPEMSTVDPFTMVSEATLASWATKDRWIEKRIQYRDQISDKIRARLGDEHVRHHIQMLKDMQGVYVRVVELLLDEDAPKPKSFESLLNSYTKLVLAIGETRRDVVGFLAPRPDLTTNESGDPSSAAPHMVPEISDDEARIAAEAILRQRMSITDGKEETKEAGQGPKASEDEDG